MSSPKRYFMARIGNPHPFSTTGRGVGGIVRRDYEIIPLGMEGTVLVSSLTSKDFNAKDVQLDMVPRTWGKVRFDITGFEKPGDVLEGLCRKTDPDMFKGTTPQVMASPDNVHAEVQRLLGSLHDAKNRADNEVAPHPDSVARLMRFLRMSPNLVSPALFSSQDGTVRARWQHGSDHTLFVGFPAQGPLPLTVSFPRQGNYGMIRTNMRCLEDEDIIQLSAKLGVRMTRS